MIFSKSCIYGIRSAIYLAEKHSDMVIPIREISRELEISFHYLTKILQRMARKKIVTSTRGNKGGVKLTRPPEQIAIKEIIAAFDDEKIFSSCVLGFPGCGEEGKCPLHDKWYEVRGGIDKLFQDFSLADLKDYKYLKGSLFSPHAGHNHD